MGRLFYITDVFHHGAYTGNQLATVADSSGLSSDEMQSIAAEFGFAETTFLMGGDASRGFDVRIFGPGGELPFAGHPTLGSAYVIRDHVAGLDTDLVELNLRVGKIPVTFSKDGVLWMRQNEPVFGDSPSREEVADGLSLSPADVDGDHPAQHVSTGLDFLIVPLVSMEALKRCVVERPFRGAFVFCRGGYGEGQSIAARNIWTDGGRNLEDAATGSASGCLASYLVEHEYLGSNRVDVSLGQGYEMGRPSTLHLRASVEGGRYDINVGGRVQLVARGELLV